MITDTGFPFAIAFLSFFFSRLVVPLWNFGSPTIWTLLVCFFSLLDFPDSDCSVFFSCGKGFFLAQPFPFPFPFEAFPLPFVLLFLRGCAAGGFVSSSGVGSHSFRFADFIELFFMMAPKNRCEL